MYVTCGGGIQADITHEYGYGYSCCSGGPDIVVNYRCNRCKATITSLPRDPDDAAKMLDAHIASLPQPTE